MLKKNVVLTLGLFMLVALIFTFIPATYAQQGGENFIFINYIGQEMMLDLDDVTYIIPGTDTVPEGGRLVLELAEGEHKYAANIPGGPAGSAGEFTISPGGYVAKAASVRRTEVPVDHDGFVIGDVKDYVYVFDFDPFAAPVEETPVVDTWQPTAPVADMGRFVWINYYSGHELTVDLAGQLYKVPPQSNNIPGRLEVDVPPGFYRYTVSVPNGSLNGEITVLPGQVTGLGIAADLPEPVEYEIGDEYQALPPVTLRLLEEDLTGRAQQPSQQQPESAPATLPTTGGQVIPARVETTTNLWLHHSSLLPPPLLTHHSPPEGLLVKNYTGDTLVFTINEQTYTIADKADLRLSLPSGHYNYTASLPYVATTGTVALADGQDVELSITINVNHDLLSVYQK